VQQAKKERHDEGHPPRSASWTMIGDRDLNLRREQELDTVAGRRDLEHGEEADRPESWTRPGRSKTTTSSPRGRHRIVDIIARRPRVAQGTTNLPTSRRKKPPGLSAVLVAALPLSEVRLKSSSAGRLKPVQSRLQNVTTRLETGRRRGVTSVLPLNVTEVVRVSLLVTFTMLTAL